MKKSLIKYYLILAVIFGVAVNRVVAQPKLSNADAKMLVEKVVLVTDRETYCVEEDILFSAFNTSSAQLQKSDWSNVLYVELIDPAGTPIVQKKLEYKSDGAEGQIQIPDWVLTGNYYLKAYTRWMRNYPISDYSYKMVQIINPYRTELLESDPDKPVSADGMLKTAETALNIRLKSDRNVYAARELVNLEVSKGDTVDLQGKMVVSVIKKGTEIKKIFQLQNSENSFISSEFIPETRGVSISGEVINEADSLPLRSTLVGLTVFDQSPENLNILTNEKGRFFFDLHDRKGEREIFISSKPNSENVTPLILVDNDFSSQKAELPFIPVDLSPASKELYRAVALNTQILSRYKDPSDTITLKKENTFSNIFYGNPEFVLRLDDYIHMPTVQDYFFELIHKARVKQEGNKHVLKIVNQTEQMEVYDPLILMDMVSVFDVEKILELKPEKLDRIEIISTPYIRGNITYGGIISFFSKKHDLAGIDLPSAGRFISYQMLSEKPAEPALISDDLRIPDSRNCLYWNPDFEINKGETIRMSFPAGDIPGEYLIVIQGVDKSGRLKIFTKEIHIE